MFCKTITENSGICNKRKQKRVHKQHPLKLEVIHTNTHKKFVNLLTTAILSIVCKLFSPPAEPSWEHWTTRESEIERASYTFDERILKTLFFTFLYIYWHFCDCHKIKTNKRACLHRTSTTTTFGAPPTEAHLSENFPWKKIKTKS